MKISTWGYSAKQGLKNIKRNKMFSLASVSTIAVCIFLFSIFFVIVVNFRAFIKEAESSVCVQMFFEEGVTEEQIEEIGKKIEAREEVSEYKFVTAEEAWESYKQIYFKEAPELISTFDGDNPLTGADNYEIYLTDVSKQEELIVYLESIDGVGKINKSEVLADSLTDVNMLVSYASIALIVILLAVAVFLISNTVATGITVRSEEIRIMKLIGATDFFVKAPFLVEGIIIGLVGAGLPLIIIFFLYRKVMEYIAARFQLLANMIEFIPMNQVFSTLIPVALIMGIGVGFIGSYLTIRRHLKV
jgi:cell division transport system permease protein